MVFQLAALCSKHIAFVTDHENVHRVKAVKVDVVGLITTQTCNTNGDCYVLSGIKLHEVKDFTVIA